MTNRISDRARLSGQHPVSSSIQGVNLLDSDTLSRSLAERHHVLLQSLTFLWIRPTLGIEPVRVGEDVLVVVHQDTAHAHGRLQTLATKKEGSRKVAYSGRNRPVFELEGVVRRGPRQPCRYSVRQSILLVHIRLRDTTIALPEPFHHNSILFSSARALDSMRDQTHQVRHLLQLHQ